MKRVKMLTDNIVDQKDYWNKLHNSDRLKPYSHNLTNFAKEVAQLLPAKARVLELGCGLGNDSFYFVKSRHIVIAVDFSDEIIRQNKARYKNTPNLIFKVLDISKSPYEFLNVEFDAVYARLSLHYFTDKLTKKIVRETHRILKAGGLLCFLCKSTKDPLYGQGRKIERDMYELSGHIRHFFSEEYTKKLLKNKFEIVKLESGREEFYGKKSAYLKVVATKL